MNTHPSAHSTLFQDRDLGDANRRRQTPARFSTEPEGEGFEGCLRVLLVACLIAAMFCGVNPGRFANVHRNPPTLPDAHTALAMVQPCATPAAKPL